MKTLILAAAIVSIALAGQAPTIPTGFGHAVLSPTTDSTFAYQWNALEPMSSTDTIVFQMSKVASCSISVSGNGLIIYSDGTTIIPDSWNVTYFPIDSSPTETIFFTVPSGSTTLYIQKTAPTILPNRPPSQNKAWIHFSPISTKITHPAIIKQPLHQTHSACLFDLRGRILPITHSHQITIQNNHPLKLR